MVGLDGSATNTTVDSVEESRSGSKSKACRAQERRVPGDGDCIADPMELLNTQKEEEEVPGVTQQMQQLGLQQVQQRVQRRTARANGSSNQPNQTKRGVLHGIAKRVAAIEATTAVQQRGTTSQATTAAKFGQFQGRQREAGSLQLPGVRKWVQQVKELENWLGKWLIWSLIWKVTMRQFKNQQTRWNWFFEGCNGKAKTSRRLLQLLTGQKQKKGYLGSQLIRDVQNTIKALFTIRKRKTSTPSLVATMIGREQFQ